MLTNFREEAKRQHRNAELAQKKADLLEQLAAIDEAIAGDGIVKGGKKGHRGRPKGVKNKVKAEKEGGDEQPKRKRGRPRKEKPVPPQKEEKARTTLPSLVAEFVKQNKKATLADLVNHVNEAITAGTYHSDAKDIANMIKQCVGKLITKGVLSKDEESREYKFVA